MHETAILLRDLVSLPSVNPMGRALQGPEYLEHRVTAYLEDWFKKLGVSWQRQPVAPRRDNILARYDAPTNIVWLLGRTQTNGAADYDNVHTFQKGMRMMPMSAYPMESRSSARRWPSERPLGARLPTV